jgi:DNA-binding transcriptional MocR family regulator
MTDFQSLAPEALQEIKAELLDRYREFQSRRITLDMTRGKPCAEQLDLAMDMLENMNDGDVKSESGADCRNYGGLDGIPEAKSLFAEYMGADTDEIIIGASSSLTMMHDAFMRAMVKGISADTAPWMQQPGIKFLCPSPGYDRHFFICEYLGIEMIPVETNDDGPDMDAVEELVKDDESTKGIWCVPKYSNPTGIVYSDDVVDRLAGMQVKAPDFRIFWDNAYAVHHLSGSPAVLKNILAACKDAGNPDRVLMWGSTSKISFAGAGIAMMAGSRANMDRARKQMAFQTIGPDKLNQLRHVKFFKNMDGILDHMQKHAAILKPKFDAVEELLEKALGGKNIATWSRPEGGYFVSLDTLEGCAAAVIELAADAGVKLTPAGSTYPLKKDPLDRNIRLAPSFPPMDDIRQAMELVGICVQLVSIDKILSE